MSRGKANRELSVIMIALAAALLLLSGCGDGSYAPKFKDVNYYKGSDGLVMDFMNEQSLDEVYEGSSFAMSLFIENRGAHSIVGNDQAILTLGYDPFYVSASKEGAKENMLFGASSVVIKGLNLVGKSRYYPTGSKLFFHFPYLMAKNVTGQRSKPETQLFASLCYPYSTTLSQLVCIDFDIYDDNARNQACKQQDISLSDQGAPVAVTLVEVDNQPVGNGLVRPFFTIHIENVGGGTVLSPSDSGLEMEKACMIQELDKQDFNRLKIEAWLSNNIKLDCAPDEVRLTLDEGIVRCSVSGEDLNRALAWRQNYEAPLTVNLTYFYMNTLKKDMEIKRINQYGDLSSMENEGCFPYQIASGSGSEGKEGEENCINKCDYCAANPTDASCNPSTAAFQIQWNPDFGCKCSYKSCETLYPQGLCLPMANYCPPASYCCSDVCKSTEIRYEGDGNCYPKCSTCSVTKKKCACGTDESGYTILEEGQCCSKEKRPFTDEETCKVACEQETAAAAAAAAAARTTATSS
ncbi:hypothetical protein JW826_05560 [Candidatus Woesearchaeota archaeon]|nr:hypothetical protein [Candidatus Woesearchaeota archaeon]